jgi:hypothetical protein
MQRVPEVYSDKESVMLPISRGRQIERIGLVSVDLEASAATPSRTVMT